MRIFHRLDNQALQKGFTPWHELVTALKARDEEMARREQMDAEERRKHNEIVIERFRRKLGNKCLFVTLAAWQGFVAKLKWERLVIVRFAKKMSQRQVISSFSSWVDFRVERKRIKALLARILGRLDHRSLQKGFFPCWARLGPRAMIIFQTMELLKRNFDS